MLVGGASPSTNLDDVATADDRFIPGPGGACRCGSTARTATAVPGPRSCSATAAASCSATWTPTTASAGRCRGTPTRSSSRLTTGSRRSTARLPPQRMCTPRGAGSIAHADELGIDPSRALIAGDSAGGNLAAVTALMCREQDAPMPAGQVLIYPVIDPSFDTESYRKYASGLVNTAAAMQPLLAGIPRRRDAAVAGVSGGTGAGRIARGPAARSRSSRPGSMCCTARGVVCTAAARRECACGASRLPGPLSRLPDDHAVQGGPRGP